MAFLCHPDGHLIESEPHCCAGWKVFLFAVRRTKWFLKLKNYFHSISPLACDSTGIFLPGLKTFLNKNYHLVWLLLTVMCVCNFYEQRGMQIKPTYSDLTWTRIEIIIIAKQFDRNGGVFGDILDHPKVFFSPVCAPGSEWAKFVPSSFVNVSSCNVKWFACPSKSRNFGGPRWYSAKLPLRIQDVRYHLIPVFLRRPHKSVSNASVSV